MILVMVIAVWSSLGFSEDYKMSFQEAMKYDGTYSLYVSLDSGMTINWITNNQQQGKVVLKDEKGSVIEQYDTEPSRVHSFVPERKPNSMVTLEFGGEESGMEIVHLRSKFRREKGKGTELVALHMMELEEKGMNINGHSKCSYRAWLRSSLRWI